MAFKQPAYTVEFLCHFFLDTILIETYFSNVVEVSFHFLKSISWYNCIDLKKNKKYYRSERFLTHFKVVCMLRRFPHLVARDEKVDEVGIVEFCSAPGSKVLSSTWDMTFDLGKVIDSYS